MPNIRKDFIPILKPVLMSKMSAKSASLHIFALSALLLLVCLGQLPSVSSADLQSNGPHVVVLVDSRICDALASSLQQYKEDVIKSGFSVNLTETSRLLNETREGVKEYLQRFWNLTNQTLTGAVLVGDIPEAWYEVGSNVFPTDLYYMDMNGTWMDTNGNGIDDRHLDPSGPEIWVGRLKVSTVAGEPVDLLKRYFDRNHLFRNNLVSIPWWRALLYMDDKGVAQGHDALTPLRYIAPQVVSVTDGLTTNADDYKMRLQDPDGYQWLYLMSHGNSTYHMFQVPSKENLYEWDGAVYASDYRTLNPHVLFYHFFVCSGGRYTDEDYLAGASVFGNDYGLLAVASTDDTFTYPYNILYRAMSEGRTIGYAFHQWLRNSTTDYTRRPSTGLSLSDLLSNSDYETLLHSMVLIGDPTLRLHIEHHDVRVADLRASIVNASDLERLKVSFTVENAGDFSETFDATVYVDSDLVYHAGFMLEARTNETVTFFPEGDAKYVWSEFINHKIRAEISSVQWEFNGENNVRDEYFVSKIIHRSLLAVIPEVVFAIAGVLFFGAMGWSFLRLLMADRPLYHVHQGLAKLNARIKTIILRSTN